MKFVPSFEDTIHDAWVALAVKSTRGFIFSRLKTSRSSPVKTAFVSAKVVASDNCPMFVPVARVAPKAPPLPDTVVLPVDAQGGGFGGGGGGDGGGLGGGGSGLGGGGDGEGGGGLGGDGGGGVGGTGGLGGGGMGGGGLGGGDGGSGGGGEGGEGGLGGDGGKGGGIGGGGGLGGGGMVKLALDDPQASPLEVSIPT